MTTAYTPADTRITELCLDCPRRFDRTLRHKKLRKRVRLSVRTCAFMGVALLSVIGFVVFESRSVSILLAVSATVFPLALRLLERHRDAVRKKSLQYAAEQTALREEAYKRVGRDSRSCAEDISANSRETPC